MAASLRDPGSIPGGGPKRFHDSFNFVFYIVGECISCAADTHLATDLTCYCSQIRASPNCTDVPSTSHNLSVWCDYHKCLLSSESHECLSGLVRLCLLVLFPSLSHHTSLHKDFFIGRPPRMISWWWAGPPACIWPTLPSRAPPLATLQLAADETYQNGYFRQPAGLVWHN